MYPEPKPPWGGVAREMESLVRKALFQFDLVTPHIAIALSGGKDSLCLLFQLAAIRGRGFPPFTLTAIHVDGEFSCGAGVNRSYLEKVTGDLGIEMKIKESTKTREGLECYSCSRERRRLLFEGAREAGATSVAFGHHRDDSAQTLLLNLLHKGEFAAMLPKVPMEAYGVTITRPLILVSEEMTKEMARQFGFARISCQCPVGQDSKRKRVDGLIKEMEREFPHARSNLAKGGLLYGSDKALRP